MNILFSCGVFYPIIGGSTTLVDDLACALLRAGHSVSVLTRSGAGLAQRESFHNYEIHRMDFPVPYERWQRSRALWMRSPGIFRDLVALLGRNRIDTVCIGLLDMSAWYLLALQPLFRFRLVLYLHGGETRVLPVRQPSFKALLRTVLRRCDAVIAVSEELKEEIAQYWPAARAKTVVILNAIDLAAIRAAKIWAHPRPYIAAVGRLVWEKDFATLLRAYAAVQEEIGDLDLLIAGDGGERGMLCELALACPRPGGVVFLGEITRNDALSVIKGSCFLVVSSVTEALPIAVVEALALGKPIIATTLPGVRAVIEDGRQGRLFPPGDAEALGKALIDFSTDRELLRRTIAWAEAAHLDRFDMAVVAARHLAVFEGTI